MFHDIFVYYSKTEWQSALLASRCGPETMGAGIYRSHPDHRGGKLISHLGRVQGTNHRLFQNTFLAVNGDGRGKNEQRENC